MKTSPFISALTMGTNLTTPVWFMRQAGRSLPEYRATKGTTNILDAIAEPELAAKITMQPVERYGVDAAVLYSDIIVPVNSIGFGIEIEAGIGPVTKSPYRSERDLTRLEGFDPFVSTPYVLETIRLLKSRLEVPLIGFAGAPFTVASYLIEGRPTRTFEATKAMMYGDGETFKRLMERLSEITYLSLKGQIEAGVDAVQIFDSWVGNLSVYEYANFVAPHVRYVVERVKELNVPIIHFGTNTTHLLGEFAKIPTDGVSLENRSSIPEAIEILGSDRAIQGNLDPILCLTNEQVMIDGAKRVLLESRAAKRYVFNLGHGVLPSTDPIMLEKLVKFVHENGPELRS
ncbi:MAG: uroporphyrinogen decarboxylase [Actinomycetota bacterium]|nr:uroporphyrinogen decarboxylase [Actinomycetota bacterium]